MYPGDKQTEVQQGGDFLRLHSPSKPADSDEGRGVALFDNFTIDLTAGMPGPNPRRIAQSILDYVKDPAVVDVRYVALAIAKGCIMENTLGKFATKEDLTKFIAFQTRKTQGAVTDFKSLVADTDMQRKSLPQLKANLQSRNLEELIKANGDTVTGDRVNANIAQRSTEGRYSTDSVKGMGWMIDRELYGGQNTTIALLRLYLEPLPPNKDDAKLPVDEWSMSVLERSTTYTFGDLLPQYITQLQSALTTALTDQGKKVDTCSDLAAGSIKAFNAATNKTPPE